MVKILYACNNNTNSVLQAERILFALKSNSNFQIKVSSYLNKGPFGIKNSDWTLNSLLDIFQPNHFSIHSNYNFQIYLEQIRSYAPDLVISDLEYFTSQAAILLNIPLWQCSPSLLNFGLNKCDKYNLGFHKKFSYLEKNLILQRQFSNIINNSEKNFVYSHLGDVGLALSPSFEWLRPYHKLGKESKPCHHSVVAISPNLSPKILKHLLRKQDCIIFSYYPDQLNQIRNKDLNNTEEFYCNLRNSNVVVCEAEPTYLADAYYNFKHTFLLSSNVPSYLISGIINEKLGLSRYIYGDEDIDVTKDYSLDEQYITRDSNIFFLHDKLNTLIYKK